ncbi:chorismate-binding protein [Streptomyces sp. NPDC048291]|uniref:chorismate-binding protein n=1 Tax=Streptomyces sp. NPDC048291 TaxID=3365530 RepID=UPI0037192CAC
MRCASPTRDRRRTVGFDPYRLVEPVEALFGSLFFYRSPDPAGRRRYLLASLADAWELRTSGLHHQGRPVPGTPARHLDDLLRTATEQGGELVFALAYDSLRAAPARPDGTAPEDRLLGFVARVGAAVRYDESDGSVEISGDDVLRARLGRIVERCLAEPAPAPLPRDTALCEVLSPLDEARYTEQLEAVRGHLRRGDVYQAVISQSVRVRPRMPVPEYFRQISHRYLHADFSYWVSLGGQCFFGACSLPHLAVTGDRVSTRVFAGTQPAAPDSAELARVRRTLREDPKYFAEHIMLVDLERNDLGKFCVPGSISVDDPLEPIVIGPTTYLATTVRGRLARPLDAAAVLGNFPRGVVTGAPKVRAERLLDEIEDTPRGFYTGAVGWYRGDGADLVSSTVVTCGVRDGDDVLLRCAGGVTVESTAAQELHELQLKLAYLV